MLVYQKVIVRLGFFYGNLQPGEAIRTAQDLRWMGWSFTQPLLAPSSGVLLASYLLVFGKIGRYHPYVINKPVGNRHLPGRSLNFQVICIRGSQNRQRSQLASSHGPFFLCFIGNRLLPRAQARVLTLGTKAPNPTKKTHRCSRGTGSSEEATKKKMRKTGRSATWIKVAEFGTSSDLGRLKVQESSLRSGTTLWQLVHMEISLVITGTIPHCYS